MVNKNSNRHHSSAWNENIRKGLLGKKHTEERRNNMRKKHNMSISGSRNIAKSNIIKNHLKKGIPLSEKNRQGMINYWINNGYISNVEKALASAMIDKNISFIHQHNIRGTPDFFIYPNICIFVDGVYYHGNKDYFNIYNRDIPKKCVDRRIKDFWITKYLEDSGYIVLRFLETDVINRIEWCVTRISKVVSVYNHIESNLENKMIGVDV